jgi:hypothetical protein
MAAYKDKSRLGEGGCADVWLCERSSDGQLVAKKILRSTAKPHMVERFRQEVRILAKLDHPNIVKVVDTQLAAAPYWFVMPLYKTSLRDEMTRVIGDGARTQKLFSAILDGIEYAHKEGVIHRDLKAANVLLNNDDDLVISDFGIGRILDAEGDRFTRTGAKMGSYAYMSPEQSTDAKHVDARSDIYSLGRMLYELHTERLNTAVQDLNRLSPAIARIVERCTQHHAQNRYQTISELKDAWRSAIASPSREGTVGTVHRLIAELIAAPTIPANAQQLFAILLADDADNDLLREAIMEIPDESIDLFLRTDRPHARKAVTSFVEHVLSQTWGATYVDKIGNKCGNLYVGIADSVARAELLRCVVILAVRFKRYAMFEIIAHLVQLAADPTEQREVVDRLKSVPVNVRSDAGKWLDLDSLAPEMAAMFRP